MYVFCLLVVGGNAFVWPLSSSSDDVERTVQ